MESQTDETNYGNSAVINRNITRTPSPEPDYDSDTSDEFSDLNASNTKLNMNYPSIATQEKEDDNSGILYDESFECLDDLLMLELLEPPLESCAIPDWKMDWPDVGKHWTDLNSHDNGEMIEEETGNDLGQEDPMEELAKNKEIIEHLIEVFKTDPKSLKAHGSTLWENMEHITGQKASTMVSKFRRVLNPMIPSMDLETNLHLEFMKKARTEIKKEVKEQLENKHGVTITLNPKGRIEKWNQKSQGARGEGQAVESVKVVHRLVDYSSSEDEPSD